MEDTHCSLVESHDGGSSVVNDLLKVMAKQGKSLVEQDIAIAELTKTIRELTTQTALQINRSTMHKPSPRMMGDPSVFAVIVLDT